MIYPFSRFKTIELIFILTPLLPYNVVSNRKKTTENEITFMPNIFSISDLWKVIESRMKRIFLPLMPEQKMKI